ncbi:spore germination protein [Paenibacillus whitsoniae]|uniref:Spore germination protein n=1 Tax=Paenibacillus whitsoniae TaxID=2496558 RepID=A0A430JI47_9BACL|nr:spore germination protein [Paenibacillus whitsoniae]RTE10718.1 spore germination protein [Paenibacillus whitsoniae]
MNAVCRNDELGWTEERLCALFSHSADVTVRVCQFGTEEATKVVIAYSDGLSDTSALALTVLPALGKQFEAKGSFQAQSLQSLGSLQLIPYAPAVTSDEVAESLFQGELVLLFPSFGGLYHVSIEHRPQRTPYESSTEISIKGPKDCFIEDIVVNAALIRKRIRSTTLRYETFTLGQRTKTKAGLFYFEDLVPPKALQKARSRLANIDVEGIFTTNQIDELLADAKYAILPQLATTGRPDFAVNALLTGRFVILIDGNPMVLIGPADLPLLLKSPEDAHFSFYYVSFARIIRILCLLVSIFLPGLWAALMAFHPDQLPFRLMATISVSRIGLPLSAQIEMFLLLMLLEIFREAGVRLPSSIGQTMTSIGGLIIGDAAIRAGLVSPSIVVIGAITAVAGVTLINQTLSTMTSIMRLLFFFFGALMGMYGMILGIILFFIYVSQLTSFGIPYLPALSPPRLLEAMKAFIRLPWRLMNKRLSFLGRNASGDREADEE